MQQDLQWAQEQPNAVSNAIDYAKFFSRWHDAVIRVYDDAGNVIETHEHVSEFKERCVKLPMPQSPDSPDEPIAETTSADYIPKYLTDNGSHM